MTKKKTAKKKVGKKTAKKFDELRKKMSPERRARNKTLAENMLKALGQVEGVCSVCGTTKEVDFDHAGWGWICDSCFKLPGDECASKQDAREVDRLKSVAAHAKREAEASGVPIITAQQYHEMMCDEPGCERVGRVLDNSIYRCPEHPVGGSPDKPPPEEVIEDMPCLCGPHGKPGAIPCPRHPNR